jgi:hypothetical protein
MIVPFLAVTQDFDFRVFLRHAHGFVGHVELKRAAINGHPF